jgi:hypothetical protein
MRGSTASSQVDGIDHTGTETSSISSRISLRHGLSADLLRLLSANPPETKITNLSELESCSNSINITIDDTTTVNDLCPGNDSSPQTRSTKSMIDNETGTKFEKHPDLWFEDGSVICRAENTLFCVHMSQLARHSLVFNDMFMLPQGSGPEESIRMAPFMAFSGLRPSSDGMQLDVDGNPEPRTTTRTVPVVYLYDAAEDVANLFTALYDGPYVPEYQIHNRLLLTILVSFRLQIVRKQRRRRLSARLWNIAPLYEIPH